MSAMLPRRLYNRILPNRLNQAGFGDRLFEYRYRLRGTVWTNAATNIIGGIGVAGPTGFRGPDLVGLPVATPPESALVLSTPTVRIPNPPPTAAQHLEVVSDPTEYRVFHDGTAPWAMYVLCKPIGPSVANGFIAVNFTTATNNGIWWRTQSGALVRCIVGSTAGNIVDISTPAGSVPDDVWSVLTFRFNVNNIYELLVNDVVLAASAVTVTQTPGPPQSVIRFLAANGHILESDTVTQVAYVGTDHSLNGVGTRVYEAIKLEWPNIGAVLP